MTTRGHAAGQAFNARSFIGEKSQDSLPTRCSRGEERGFHAARGPRSRRAFTLVELMVAMGIMVLILTWGVPSFLRVLKKDAFRQTVSDVLEACSHARARAILAGDPMEMVIRAEDGSITVRPLPRSEPTRSLGDGTGAELDPEPSPERAERDDRLPPLNVRLAESVAVELLDVNFRDHMQADEAHVRFYPNGTADEFTMVLFSPEGFRTKVWLDVVTGLADSEDIR